MRDTLEALAEGDISVAEAEAALAGYATTEAGRFDAARETRRGVPEGIYAEGKTPAEVATLAAAAVETTGRALVTRADADDVAAVEAEFGPDARVDHRERAGVVVVHGPDFEAPALDATVTIVTGGTADAVPAGEAAAVVAEMGATVERIADVGVANLTRITDQVGALRAADVLVVAAGREGALPTVVAGLVDTPVIGLPVASGYGVGGEGRAALHGMLQSCTVLSTVNVDAGYVAGAQAGLIARAVADAR
ncbi:MAG: nickel pincer cofactor biosynthesis protein LarB [Halobacteriaceae archaeon]